MSSDPVTLFASTLSPSEPFTEGAKKIAAFARRTEDRFEPAQLIRSLLGNTIDAPLQEYILFSILDVSRADFELLEKATRLRQLRHLAAKFTFAPDNLTENERAVVAALPPALRSPSINNITEAARAATSLVSCLLRGLHVALDDLDALAVFVKSEAAALKARSEWLSEHVDAYNMRAIARILPLLTVCDEQASALEEIAGRIGRHDQLGRAVLTFEYAMGTDSFEKWVKKASKEPSVTPFLEMLKIQRVRLVPVRNLVAVATLSRCLHSSGAPVLTWIHHALECTTAEGFRIDAGNDIRRVQRLLERCSITPDGTVVSGSFAGAAFMQLTGPDMLTCKEIDDQTEPSPRELVARCMNNDLLLMRLLDNPRISGAPGVVERIATNSRSTAVLQKIALTKELYSGYTNNGVPLALLRNPTHLPLNHLRPFINIKYVSFNDLKTMLNNPYGVRPDVFNEVKAFVGQRYT